MRERNADFPNTGEVLWMPVADGEYQYEHPYDLLCPELTERDAAKWLGGHECGQLDEHRWISDYSCLLLRCKGETVLLDTGGGDVAPSMGKLPASLRRLGIEPVEVGCVVLTHGHPDHVGGCLDSRGRPAFPNARYLMAVEEWDFWQSGPTLEYVQAPEAVRELMRRVFRENVLPLGSALELVRGRMEVAPGVEIFPTPGHTPGHMAVTIHRGEAAYVYAGDAFLTPAHEERPDCRTAIDRDHGLAMESRKAILREVSDKPERILGFHYPRNVLERRMK